MTKKKDRCPECNGTKIAITEECSCCGTEQGYCEKCGVDLIKEAGQKWETI